jgi:hypothetical protein
MTPMRNSPVIAISEHQERSRRVGRAMAARRRLDALGSGERRTRNRGGGRIWVNGHEIGGTDPRHAHLAHSFD